MKLFLLPLWLILLCSLNAQAQQLQVGAEQLPEILRYTTAQRIGITTNHTGILPTTPLHTHLVDTLLSHRVQVVALFSPEHGLRGDADAGTKIASGRDPLSGLPLYSLYGSTKKPQAEWLKGIDLMLFDLQDVGTRFYTYLSTLYYVMEACAEQQVPLLLLDRPNPHDTIDGPLLLEEKYRSFIGMLPLPAVHGLTLGEAAQMINGEGWLPEGKRVDLTVIPVKGWRHGEPYSLPVPPSPNLRSDRAIALYPTLCYLEGSSWSEGRGTARPFEQIGYPRPMRGAHSFVPQSVKGATAPKHQGRTCYGPNLDTEHFTKGVNVALLSRLVRLSARYKIPFFRPRMFDLLAGNSTLRHDLQRGLSPVKIRASWQADLSRYRTLRARYLLYPDYSELPKGKNLTIVEER